MAVVDGRVVGFSDLVDGAVLDMLFVHPDAGGRGVAKALVGAVLEHARQIGSERIETQASRSARPAFERFGFVVDAVQPDNRVRGVTVPNVRMHIDVTGTVE